MTGTLQFSLRARWKLRLVLPAIVASSWAGVALAEPPAVDEAPQSEAQAPADGAAVEEATKFLRVTRDDRDKLVAMETAIVRYVPSGDGNEGLAIDLVAAVHVGEQEYYEALNDTFEEYDAVLYELVAPDEAPMPNRGGRSAHPIAMLQGGLQGMLELEHQLKHIDYERDNFVHADMSPDEFEQSMSERNENFLSMFFRMMGHSIAQQAIAAQRNPQARQSDAGVLLALFNQDRAMSMRQLMAEQFEGLDGMIGGLDGPSGSTLISERNKVAMEVLREQIAEGKRKIAIFYGAGHMRDFERRLAELDLKRDSQRWITAWELARDKDAAKENDADDSP